jgi:hypothetical protein
MSQQVESALQSFRTNFEGKHWFRFAGLRYDRDGSMSIEVYLDEEYWHHKKEIPFTWEGCRVRVEILGSRNMT